MKKGKIQLCDEEIDFLNHMLNEQITRICVLEEEERMEKEIRENPKKGYST